tara:strand:- start:138 stop:1637 length:1500 start_codon:yes stop_codon:yes gene_type:complete
MTSFSSFKDYLVEDQKIVYFTFGRMNPPTIGHGLLLDALSKASGKNPYKIFLSHSSDDKKNPLKYTDKVKFVRKMFPKHSRSVILNKDIKNVFQATSSLFDDGYKQIVMVVGSDRVDEFKGILNKYNGKEGRHGFYNFKSISVVSAGQRDADSEGAEGASATKQRKHAASNDFTKFSQGLPDRMSDKDAKGLFNAVRSGLGLKEQKDFKTHIQLATVSATREEFVKRSVFNEGDFVNIKDIQEKAIIKSRGSNYLILEKEDGSTVRKWLDSVESLNEAVKKVAPPKWKKSGANGEKEITFSTGRRFQIEKQYDQNERHAGEWKVMEWNKSTRDWEWHETYSPQWHAKEMVMELGKYDSKGKKVSEDFAQEPILEAQEIGTDSYRKHAEKKYIPSADVKEGPAMDDVSDKISQERERLAVAHDRMKASAMKRDERTKKLRQDRLKRQTESFSIEEKLSVSDGMSAWIKDFETSDAPQFKNADAKKRKEMAIAAYMDKKNK